MVMTSDDSTHEGHASMLRWVGGPFDPAAFDLAEVHERLAPIKVCPSDGLDETLTSMRLLDGLSVDIFPVSDFEDRNPIKVVVD